MTNVFCFTAQLQVRRPSPKKMLFLGVSGYPMRHQKVVDCLFSVKTDKCQYRSCPFTSAASTLGHHRLMLQQRTLNMSKVILRNTCASCTFELELRFQASKPERGRRFRMHYFVVEAHHACQLSLFAHQPLCKPPCTYWNERPKALKHPDIVMSRVTSSGYAVAPYTAASV